MNLLFTGRGTSGSWQIRGLQVARAVGAESVPMATTVAGYDLAVVVKRAPEDILGRLRAANVPIIWDVVDAWPQPVGNDWARWQCMHWLNTELKRIRPIAVVAATMAMQRDVETLGFESCTVPHHYWTALDPNPVRDKVAHVGYMGGPNYLGRWLPAIQEECDARGWKFTYNGLTQLAKVDIVVGVREATGYAPRNWKSNVKLANAQGTGTPCVMAREQGALETASGGELWADTFEEMRRAFDALTPHVTRQQAAWRLTAGAPHLKTIATTYRQWLLSKS
jgi:hypothetical protein